MVKEDVEVSPLNLTNRKGRDQEELDAISINGFVTDSVVRKVAQVSGSKGVLRSPFQWLYDIMNGENFIEIKRVMAPDGRKYIVIDRVKEAE